MQTMKRRKIDYDYTDDRVLRRMWYDATCSLETIAEELGRTQYGITKRAERLGLGSRRRILLSDTDEEAYTRDILIEMDNRFCEAMRSAIDNGLESAPLGISTVPGTKFPILIATRGQLPASSSVANECADA